MKNLIVNTNDYFIKRITLILTNGAVIPSVNITMEYLLWRAYQDYQKFIKTNLKCYSKYASDLLYKYIFVDTIDSEVVNRISLVYSNIDDILYRFPEDLAIIFSKSDFGINDINDIIYRYYHNNISLLQDNTDILPVYIKLLTEYMNDNRIFTRDITEEQTYKIIKGILKEPFTATQNMKFAYLMFLLYKYGIIVKNWAKTVSQNNIFSRKLKKCFTVSMYNSYSHKADNSNIEIYIQM